LLFSVCSFVPLGAQDLYWDYPEILVPQKARFPNVSAGGGITAVLWQEFSAFEDETSIVELFLISRENGGEWSERKKIPDTYTVTGKEVPIFSLSVDENGIIYVAVLSSDNTVTIYNSADGGETFRQRAQLESVPTTVAPRLYVKEGGGLIMYVTRETVSEEFGESLAIYYTVSEDGFSWSPLEPLVTEQGKRLNFLPYHMSSRGKEYVVFQVLETGERPSYQIYLKTSNDGGRTWSSLKWLTGFEETVDGELQPPNVFDNQRPHLERIDGRLGMVWERGYLGNNPQIYYSEIDELGNMTAEPEPVTTGVRSCRFPRLFTLEGKRYILWFDDRAGEEHIILGRKEGVFWEDRDITRLPGVSTFGRVIIQQEDPYIFWENRRDGDARLVYLAPDRSVPAPDPIALDFMPGERFRQDRYSVEWTLPMDSSGIAGFSYTWDRDPDGTPPRRIMTLQRNREASFTAEEDGYWYFRVSSKDYAGNWSQPATISFFRDTTPPGKVTFIEPDKDENGFLRSNTVTLEWEPPEDPYVAGYSYTMQYLGGIAQQVNAEELEPREPPERIMTAEPEKYYRNWDNGTWAFSVRAIDSVGNAGEPATMIVKMNKYVPETFITTVDAPVDALGRVDLTIRGRGFAVGGDVSKVILDRDGEDPFDYEYPLEFGMFEVVNDRLIKGPGIENVDEGVYRIGLLHPKRGYYFTRPFLELESSGTVKFGDFTRVGERTWTPVKQKLFDISANTFVMVLILVLLAAGMVFAIIKAGAIVREGRSLEAEVHALITQQDLTARQKKERLAEMKKRGMGLRIKFTLFITLLVIVVVLMVSVALAYVTVNTQRESLATGLRNQTEVLLESLTSSARTYLPGKNTLELGLIPGQRSAMEDSIFVTITGGAEGDPDNYNYVWASDDPNIADKIDTAALQIGVSRINDEVLSKARELKEEINRDARAALTDITDQLDQLAGRARELALSEEEGAEEELAQYQQEISDLERQINRELKRIGDRFGSVPEFTVEHLDETQTKYVFYKPIVYRTIGQDVYYKGLVRLGVSTERILLEIDRSVKRLMFIIGIIAAAAIVLGVAFAIIFATIMIIPIRRLVEGVALIRDTEDKEELKDHQIRVKSRDEISELAETVNQMTDGLVNAAIANKELMIGKDVQRMFLPLDMTKSGAKGTTGKKESDLFSFFGYYEGASGVSGDYFDFKQLDDKHYAIIKCDVSGHGVSASLIMVEVATIFLNYFRDWTIKGKGIHLDELVYSMNDLLEERGFKGMFAALITIIINIETGVMYMCNAGDNIIYIHDGVSGSLVKHELPESPATGVFDSELVKMQSGFQQVKLQLKQGDTLFLFTDGLEEAMRYLRNSSFQVIKCDEPDLGDGEAHGRYRSHKKGEEREEFTTMRIEEIVNAVFRQESFVLEKYHNPVQNESLNFDFTDCSNSVEEAVLAVISVEKVFRLVPDPAATENDRVAVDRKIDTFLKEHFKQYSLYFTHPLESEEESDYITYTHLREDEQLDDLTILGIRKL
jgi:serine phosphatase RsbU (regulator of sigma subunit)